jgi:hypothetical protein
MRAQRIYRAVEDAGFAWLWMEHLQDSILQLYDILSYPRSHIAPSSSKAAY